VVAFQRIGSQVWLLPVYKEKGDPVECGSYKAIKLLKDAMKRVERIFDN